MLTLNQIKKHIENGHLMEAYKEVRLYGAMVRDKEFTVESGHHAGAHRVMRLQYKGVEWGFSMHNGEVIRGGWGEVAE